MSFYNLNIQNSLPTYKNNAQNIKHQSYMNSTLLNSKDTDVVELSFRGTTETTLTKNEIIGRDFGRDLIKLVENKNATPEEVQKLMNKHLNYNNIKIHSMSDYRYPNGQPLKNNSRGAITRPTFDEKGNLKQIDLFIPNVDYSDKFSVLEFIDKASHEVTHIAQFTSNPHDENYANIPEKMFMNFVEKRITDRMTDKGVVDTSIRLTKESNVKLRSEEDYLEFMDKTSNITPQQIGEYLNFGKDEKTQSTIINAIYDMLYDDLLKAMNYKNDPTILDAMKKYGGYDGLKNHIKNRCANSFANEQEAYLVGNLIRKEYNGIKSEQTNNDLINILMEMYAQALA